MVAHRRSKVAGDGWPYLIVVAIGGALAYRFAGAVWAVPFVLLDIALYFLFRDPWREVPPEPLGALAPIDGEAVEVSTEPDGVLPGDWIRITITTNRMGAYTVRAPIEGAISEVTDHLPHLGPDRQPRGMWIRSEEEHDVVLTFPGASYALGPKAFVRYGERVGQGQRFAYLRLAPRAVVYLPPESTVRIEAGERVLAGETILADLPG